MDAANLHYVEMKELMEKSGEFAARVLGCEAAYVTSGCAAALSLSTAACMAGEDREKIARLPDTTGMKSEVLIQKTHRYTFDRCFTIPGGKLIEVGDDNGCTAEQLEEAIGPKTAAVAYFVQPDWGSSVLTLEEAVEIAHGRDVPVIADAGSRIYPLDYFRSLAQSADLVCFGGKYFGAPHSTGLVCGKKELVDAVVAQGFMAFHTEELASFGRVMKVDRQEVVGLCAALDDWFSMNHEDRLLENDRRVSVIQEGLRGVPDVHIRSVQTPHFYGSTLQVDTGSGAFGKDSQQVARELYEGDPCIWVGVIDDAVTVNVHTLNPGEEEIVADRLRKVLTD